METPRKVMGSEVMLDGMTSRGGSNRPSQIIERIQQFDRAGLEGQTGRRHYIEVPYHAVMNSSVGKLSPKWSSSRLRVCGHGRPIVPAENTRGRIVARFRRCNQGRFLVERFRVEQQSIHVENNGGWHMREFHHLWAGQEDSSAR